MKLFLFILSGWMMMTMAMVIQQNISGEQISSDNFPFIVSISVDMDKVPLDQKQREAQSDQIKLAQHKCGGTLITEDWVLTAAHCVIDAETNQPIHIQSIGIGIGTNDQVEMYHLGRIHIINYIVRQNYSYDPHINDIALIQLEKKINQSVFKNKTYTTACLATIDQEEEEEEEFSAIGWGNQVRFQIDEQAHTWGPQVPSRYLEKVNMKDTSHVDSVCASRKDLLCTYRINNGIESTCRGYSGGLLIHDQHVFGVFNVDNVIDGWHCNGDAKYQRFDSHLDWIRDTIKQNICTKHIK